MEKKSSKKYFLFDCQNFVLGRMSTEIAMHLMGKKKASYAPNRTGEEDVIVVNSDKIYVSGKKLGDKMYHSFSGYPGGISSRSLDKQLQMDSKKVVWNAVYGMLPKNKLRNVMLKKLHIFKDGSHNFNNAKIEEIKPKKS